MVVVLSTRVGLGVRVSPTTRRVIVTFGVAVSLTITSLTSVGGPGRDGVPLGDVVATVGEGAGGDRVPAVGCIFRKADPPTPSSTNTDTTPTIVDLVLMDTSDSPAATVTARIVCQIVAGSSAPTPTVTSSDPYPRGPPGRTPAAGLVIGPCSDGRHGCCGPGSVATARTGDGPPDATGSHRRQSSCSAS